MKKMLSLDNVKKSFEDFTINKFSLAFPSNSTTSIIGKNGSGKSTLIKIIMKLSLVDSGKVEFMNKEYDESLFDKVGIVFDENNFFDDYNIKQINSILKHIYLQRWQEKIFYNYLKEFDISGDKKIKSFSRGMKMKLFMSIAMSHDPTILILDEATAGLDAYTKEKFYDMINSFKKRNDNFVLLISHDDREVAEVSDYIVLIDHGRKLCEGTTSKVQNLFKCVSLNNIDDSLNKYILLRCEVEDKKNALIYTKNAVFLKTTTYTMWI